VGEHPPEDPYGWVDQGLDLDVMSDGGDEHLQRLVEMRRGDEVSGLPQEVLRLLMLVAR
jgi:hypothetical protein